MVSLRKYQGTIGSSQPKSQPFRVVVSGHVLLLADLHAHLSNDGACWCWCYSWLCSNRQCAAAAAAAAEVIGFLGGKWDAKAQLLRITDVFPGKSLRVRVRVRGSHPCLTSAASAPAPTAALVMTGVVQDEGVKSNVQCEMDPLCEVQLRESMEHSGISVVGWYHSHPSFEPVPSQCDIDNQCNYQAYFRDHTSGMDPFVGLIVSPYDLRLPTLQSAVMWFNVACPQSQPTPMLVEVEYDYTTCPKVAAAPASEAAVAAVDTNGDSASGTLTADIPEPEATGVVESAADGVTPPIAEVAVAESAPGANANDVAVPEPPAAADVPSTLAPVTVTSVDALVRVYPACWWWAWPFHPLPGCVSTASCGLQMQTVTSCVSHVDCLDPNDVWRDLGGAVTNSQKLRGSLMLRWAWRAHSPWPSGVQQP